MHPIQKVPLSFEFFPPKNQLGIDNLVIKALQLQTWQPEYFSVTFGAGGTSQINTVNSVKALIEDGLIIAPHITCIGLTKENILQLLQTYKNLGIRQLVVLRGDFAENMISGYFNYACQLVEFIRAETGEHFFIEVAAYPEFHPRAKSIESDLLALKLKASLGANRAITQYFYNIEAYFRFLESCEKLDIHIPIVPGIMPIRNFQQLLRFSKICGTDLPLWLVKRLENYGDDQQSIQQFGLDVVLKLCEDLVANGAPGLHFYTLNELEPTINILAQLGMYPVPIEDSLAIS